MTWILILWGGGFLLGLVLGYAWGFARGLRSERRRMVATGRQLDQLATTWGLGCRSEGTDAELRQRALDSIRRRP